MKFRPLHDRVLIEVLDSSEKTAGGIIIPDTAQEKPQQGTVLVVGEGKKCDCKEGSCKDCSCCSKSALKAGDKVLYGKYSGTEIVHDGKELLIMRESDILAVL